MPAPPFEHPFSSAGLALGVSLALFAIGVVAVPLVIARLPADYFVRLSPADADRRHAALRAARRVLRNLAGAFLLLSGVAMLVLPGQGLLAILFGLSLLDFPGKRRLQLRVLRLPGVLQVVSAIRRRADRPPFVLDPDTDPPDGPLR